jgi:hypothetical protein
MGERRKALLSILVFLVSKLRIVPQHINMLKLSDLEGLITGANFQIVECERLKDSIQNDLIVAKKFCCRQYS